jgi:hypothetical protein
MVIGISISEFYNQLDSQKDRKIYRLNNQKRHITIEVNMVIKKLT